MRRKYKIKKVFGLSKAKGVALVTNGGSLYLVTEKLNGEPNHRLWSQINHHLPHLRNFFLDNGIDLNKLVGKYVYGSSTEMVSPGGYIYFMLK